MKDDRIGIIGPNGSGKSTLMKMITGWVKPDSGETIIGQTVKMGYFSQENEDMDQSMRVIDYIKMWQSTCGRRTGWYRHPRCWNGSCSRPICSTL